MEILPLTLLVWIGILFCISQSAMFSGLNLALLGISRLRLEVEADSGNPRALKVLALRKDVNFLLTTVLWGNVGINVLLTLLSNSVMTGLVAFLFSTVLITFAGEIAPQAYFSRHAIRMGSALAPVLRFYQLLLYPVARPSAWVLDRWLGKEGISYFREQDLHAVIRKHIEARHSEVGKIEGTGAINFLKLDDTAVSQMGAAVDPESIVMLPVEQNMPVFPVFEREREDVFLKQISHSGKKWVIIVDADNQPRLALNANTFLRDALFSKTALMPMHHCHRPIVVKDANTQLGEVLTDFKVNARHATDEVIENDLILVWGTEKRVITGTDILGRLLLDIAARETH
ncbi:MAG: DUF21 domain-containing protein [Gammaproteobacteria bacterium]|nr:DUF21 domain-containing protein [Gammaproteobacteria bacterium]